MNYYLLAFSKYAEFSGRSTRSEYWYFYLFNLLVLIAFGLVETLLVSFLGDAYPKGAVSRLGDLYGLAIIIPYFAIAARRLHDTGRSGWMQLIGLIPLIGTIWLIVLLATDSNPGDNKYGPNPKLAKQA